MGPANGIFPDMRSLAQIGLAASLLLVSTPVRAQRAPVAGEELTVYLMTMGQGDLVFEKFGHTAIWIHDSVRQTDVAYNWGLFDFNESDFIARLARGQMRYSMGGFEMRSMLQSYIDTNRSVWAQELNLSPQQRLTVKSVAEINALPQNRYYTYDYYRNNCSTLPRDLLNEVLGGGIKAATDRTLTNNSFRSHTLRLLDGEAAAYTGAHFALGHPADPSITEWQEMFLPLKLQEHVRKVRVVGRSGATEPLVVKEFQLAAAQRPPEQKEAQNYVIRFTIAGVLTALVLLILLSLSLTGLGAAKALLGIMSALLGMVGGLAGLGLILAWSVTDHVFMSKNENILQLTPLLLFLGVLFPLAFRVVRIRKTVIALAWTSAGLSVLGFLLQALSTMNQPNGEIIGLVMPIQLALALISWWLFSGRKRPARA